MTIRKWSKKGNQPPTHVLMDGGQLHVPEAELDAFWAEYVSQILSGNKLYVVEQKTDLFKFFVDVDFKGPEPLGDESAFEICHKIWEAVGTEEPCYIARAPPRPVKEWIKSGLHIHWPSLVVSRTEAMAIRTRILLALDHDSWAEIIDASVYGGSGLRCLWSHKKPEGDPYVPWRRVPDGKALGLVPNVETLKLFSVRTQGGVPRSTVPGDVMDDPSPLESFIRQNLEGQENAVIKRVRRTKRGEGKGLCVETNSRYCERIQGTHRSNHVWFYIRGQTIQQKCLDEACLEFSGREHILPPSIRNEAPNMASITRVSSVDLLPEAWRGAFQEFRAGGSQILGSGSQRMEVVPDGAPGLRSRSEED